MMARTTINTISKNPIATFNIARGISFCLRIDVRRFGVGNRQLGIGQIRLMLRLRPIAVSRLARCVRYGYQWATCAASQLLSCRRRWLQTTSPGVDLAIRTTEQQPMVNGSARALYYTCQSVPRGKAATDAPPRAGRAAAALARPPRLPAPTMAVVMAAAGSGTA